MFTIQLGHPKINTIPKQEFKTLGDIFLHLFKLEEESVFMFWNEIPLRFRYREDLFASFNDMLAVAWILQKEKKGETTATFQNQLLTMTLTCIWNNDDLSLQAHFESFEHLYEPYGNALNQANNIRLSKARFLSEWKTLFHQILVSLEASNCTIEDGVERRRLELLQQTEKSIQNYGGLYHR
ncbi:MAG: hypothetical protein AAF489_00205 [Bacteroidota bacterium]